MEKMLEAPENFPKKLFFEEVTENDPGFADAISVSAYPEDSSEKVEEELQGMLENKHWFLKEYWQKKKPQEVIEIHCGEKSMEIFNFGKDLLDWQIEEITNAIKVYNIKMNDIVFGKVRQILINDDQWVNLRTGKPMNGIGERGTGEAIVLFPSALEQKDHRVPNVSNLEGTVIHELSHTIADGALTDEWRKIFGWTKLEKPEKLVGGYYQFEKSADTKRCITDYAETAADEDICESMVGALLNPNALDKEKLEYIRGKILLQQENSDKEKPFISVIKKKESEMTFPKIQEPVKYKRVIRKPVKFKNIL